MPVKSIFSSMELSASGLTANRRWMDAIAENLANAQTTRTPEGGPYKRKVVVFSEAMKQAKRRRQTPSPLSGELRMDQQTKARAHRSRSNLKGVEAGVTQEEAQPRLVYDPAHPDANEEGYVAYPNVEVVKEMVDMITASRAYEANVTALNTVKAMSKKALEI